jgi:chromosome segregation ATPase
VSADGRRAELVEALRPKLGLRQHMAEPLADALLPLVQKIEAELNANSERIAELEAELKDASDAYWREREQHEADRLAKDTQLAAQAEAMAELDDKATQAYEDRDEAAHRAEQAEAERDGYAARLKAVDKSWTQLAAERDRLRAAAAQVQKLALQLADAGPVWDGNEQQVGMDLLHILAALDDAPAADSPYATGGIVPGPASSSDQPSSEATR